MAAACVTLFVKTLRKAFSSALLGNLPVLFLIADTFHRRDAAVHGNTADFDGRVVIRLVLSVFDLAAKDDLDEKVYMVCG